MAIRVYRSDDDGRTWRYLSEIRSPNEGGLWEPEFTIDRAGELVMFYSDETEHAKHSQMISKVRSDDGQTWRDSAASWRVGSKPIVPACRSRTVLPTDDG